MTFLSLAFLFAGVKSYGQYKGQDNPFLDGEPDCVPAVPLDCASGDNPLSPVPGKDYTYTANDAGTVTTVKDVQWFVYNATPTSEGGKGPDIIVNGSIADAVDNMEDRNNSQFLLSAEAHYGVATSPDVDGISSITLSWQSFDAEANHILLVAYVTGAEGCSDNIEVFRIKPAFSFTLDVASLMPEGVLNRNKDNNIIPAEECVSPVWSATYNPSAGVDGQLDMDYGANYLFFSVNAANYVNSWRPKIDALVPENAILGEIAWAYPTDAIANTEWNIADNNGVFPVVKPINDADAVGKDGECIVVRVLVEHGINETIVPSTVTLKIEGLMYNAGSSETDKYELHHLEDGGAGNACINDDPATADYILTPRPKIESTTANPGGTPDPLPFVPKP